MLGGCSSPQAADVSVSLRSDRGMLDADIRISAPVKRGENELSVALRPRDGVSDGQLLAVDATMAAHGHEAHTSQIERIDDEFVAKHLDLFMTGRWLVELQLSVDGEADRVSLPVDVP